MSSTELQEMCVKAIAAHASWKVKFKRLLDGEATIDSATTRRSDVCDFGKWLAGAGKAQLGAGFAAIDAAHKHFHAVAADVVDSYNAGQKQQVADSLGLKGAFARASAALTTLIVAAKNKAA
jgi:methyl-accepting chemotaxis protein